MFAVCVALSALAWVLVYGRPKEAAAAGHEETPLPREEVPISQAAEELKLGRQALERNAPREALKHFRAAAVHAPDSLTAHTYQGLTAEMLGEFDEALKAYGAAVDVERSDETVLRLATLAGRLGQVKLAIETLTGWLPRASDGAPAELLFRLLIEYGEQPAALALARDRNWLREGADYCGLPVARVSTETLGLLAMLVHPDRADCLMRLGVSLTNDGLVRLARMVLTAVVGHATSEQTRATASAFLRARLPVHNVTPLAESLNAAGYRLAYRHRRPDDAIEVYKKAIAADPSFSWPYGNIGLIYLERKEIETALEWLRKAVAVNPDHWRAQKNLGTAAFRLKRYDEALSAYIKAVELDPGDAESFATLGRLLLRLGHREQAVSALQRALALNPELKRERRLLNTLADRDQMIEEVLDLFGVKRSLVRVANELRGTLRIMVTPSADDKDLVASLLDKSFRAERLSELVTGTLVMEFDHDRLGRVLAWLRTPGTRQMVELEWEATTATPDEVKEYLSKSQGAPDVTERVQWMKRLDDAMGVTGLQSDLGTALQRAVTTVTNPLLPPERRTTREDLERYRRSVSEEVKGWATAHLFYTYRSASSEAITQYVSFWESELGRWFARLLTRSLVDATEILAGQATRDVLRALAERPQNSSRL